MYYVVCTSPHIYTAVILNNKLFCLCAHNCARFHFTSIFCLSVSIFSLPIILYDLKRFVFKLVNHLGCKSLAAPQNEVTLNNNLLINFKSVVFLFALLKTDLLFSLRSFAFLFNDFLFVLLCT